MDSEVDDTVKRRPSEMGAVRLVNLEEARARSFQCCWDEVEYHDGKAHYVLDAPAIESDNSEWPFPSASS